MSVAKNTVQNMGEDLTMMIGHSMVNKYLNEQLAGMFPPELDENGNEKMNIPLEVLSGGASYLFMAAMMEMIKREEKFIEYLFAAGEAIIAVLYARNKDYFKRVTDKLAMRKGVKALGLAKIFSSNNDPQNSFVGQVYQAMQTILNGRNASHDVANTVSAGAAVQDHALNREAQNLKFAEANSKTFHDSLIIKMATGTFTATDKTILQKVIGRSEFATVPLQVDELNKIREFMMVTDSNGKLVGLSKAFTQLLNGLGFINK